MRRCFFRWHRILRHPRSAVLSIGNDSEQKDSATFRFWANRNTNLVEVVCLGFPRRSRHRSCLSRFSAPCSAEFPSSRTALNRRRCVSRSSRTSLRENPMFTPIFMPLHCYVCQNLTLYVTSPNSLTICYYAPGLSYW